MPRLDVYVQNHEWREGNQKSERKTYARVNDQHRGGEERERPSRPILTRKELQKVSRQTKKKKEKGY